MNMSLLSTQPLVLESSVLVNFGCIPKRYTCDGDNINPPFQWHGADDRTISFVLFIEDPDAPIGVFDHWVVYNIHYTISEIQEGVCPDANIGRTTSGEYGYVGPCPPGELHWYVITVYTLDTFLDISAGATKEDVRTAMQKHILQYTTMRVYYER